MDDKEPKGGIYQIRNIENGKIYIGSSKDIKKRWYAHLDHLKRHKHHNYHLQMAYDKYGKEVFEFSVLYRTDNLDELIEKEDYYMVITNCTNPEFGYNIAPRAGGNLGAKASEETRRKMSLAQRGKKVSEEGRKNMSAGMKGVKKHYTPEQKKRLSELKKAYVPTEETKQKISKSNKGKVVGSQCYNAKLTEAEVLLIKKILRDGQLNGAEIGKIFGVGYKKISAIKREKEWVHVKLE